MKLVQGSPEWHEWRGKGLGSSDAAVLLGKSPWRTLQQLIDEKKGLWKPSFNDFQLKAMERGKKLEPLVRAMTEAKEGILFPEESSEHPSHPFMRASFDGINREASRLIEIKCGNKKDHVATFGGKVPDKYMPQVQWQLMIAGVAEGLYVSWSGPEEAIQDFSSVSDPEELKQLVDFFISEGWLSSVVVQPDASMQAELERMAIHVWGLICA